MPTYTFWNQDASIDDKLNSGDLDLAQILPETDLQGRRRRDAQGLHTNRSAFSEYRFDTISPLLPALPHYIVTMVIPDWQYEEDAMYTHIASEEPSKSIRRVFRERGQKLSLDIAQSLSAMGPNYTNKDEVIKIVGGLEIENDFDNLNNQRILQEMFENLKKGEQMIPGRIFAPYKGPQSDPLYMIQPVKQLTK
ncbi:hypothetical protein KY332_03570 [Candidatus Woesearchaeota archaeon]|nr:hypothetical protein [Candidatus Woesearchaeota archaeon]